MSNRMTGLFLLCVLWAVVAEGSPTCAADGELGRDGFADSGGVKIHFVARGKGPLLVLLHGSPDYWYTWRWLEKDPTLVTVPNAGHFVQQDAAELVTVRMVNWLTRWTP